MKKSITQMNLLMKICIANMYMYLFLNGKLILTVLELHMTELNIEMQTRTIVLTLATCNKIISSGEEDNLLHMRST